MYYSEKTSYTADEQTSFEDTAKNTYYNIMYLVSEYHFSILSSVSRSSSFLSAIADTFTQLYNTKLKMHNIIIKSRIRIAVIIAIISFAL